MREEDHKSLPESLRRQLFKIFSKKRSLVLTFLLHIYGLRTWFMCFRLHFRAAIYQAVYSNLSGMRLQTCIACQIRLYRSY